MASMNHIGLMLNQMKGLNLNLRTFHRRLALIFSPFLLLTSITGIALLFRKDEFYGKDVKTFLIGLHNWELVGKYVGTILAIGLMTITVTGIMLFWKNKKF
jgi:uncharacterized iron-regulated membrane protein